MDLFTLLDVGIGIIFIFLLLSLISTAFMELLEAWLRKRAAHLEQGITELLGNDDPSINVQALYDHPLVRALYRGSFTSAKENGQLPS